MSSFLAGSLSSTVLPLFTELSGHDRANTLHREAIIQSLRIHEAEAQAGKEYHRVDVKQGNDQHVRELLQSKVRRV